MPRYFSAGWSVSFLALCAFVIWQWVRWFKSKEQIIPRWRAATTIAGLCFVTLSTWLVVFLFIHAAYTGGYSYSHPVEMFCVSVGALSAMIGFVTSMAGAGKIRPYVATLAALNFLLWLIDAAGQ